MQDNKNTLARLRALESRFGAGTDSGLLNLMARNDSTARAELERRIAAGAGSPGMLNCASVMLAGQKQLQGLSPEELAALDAGEGEMGGTIQ